MRALPIVAVLALAACSPAAEPADPAAELASLREAALSYQAAATAKAAERVVALYDADAVMIPPNDALVEGLAGVEGYRFGFIVTPGVSLDFEILRAEVSDSGDMGWTLARGEITIENDDGTTGRDVVRDFHVWKKQADGSWKVVVDVWNSGMPAAE